MYVRKGEEPKNLLQLWWVIIPDHPLNGHEFGQTLGDSEG